jgi:hypothetical protein
MNHWPQSSIGQPHFSHGSPGVVEAEQRARLGLTDLQAGDADEDCEQALGLAERPGEGPAERTARPHSAPLLLEHLFDQDSKAGRVVWIEPAVGICIPPKRDLEGCEMPATPVREAEISSHKGERHLYLVGASELEPARLLTAETTDQQEELDPVAWQMLQGVQDLRRWIWTVVLVALTLLVISFFPPSP